MKAGDFVEISGTNKPTGVFSRVESVSKTEIVLVDGSRYHHGGKAVSGTRHIFPVPEHRVLGLARRLAIARLITMPYARLPAPVLKQLCECLDRNEARVREYRARMAETRKQDAERLGSEEAVALNTVDRKKLKQLKSGRRPRRGK